MNLLTSLLAAALGLTVCVTAAPAQQPESGAANAQVSPASAAPHTEQQPNLRSDSKPYTSLSPSTDSPPQNLGVDMPAFLDLGLDSTPSVPANMVGQLQVDNPSMIFVALEHRPPARMTPEDAALVGAKLQGAGRRYGFDFADLKGWAYEQVVCPALSQGPSPNSDAVLLQFTREGSQQPAFAAVVPRDNAPIRVVSGMYRKDAAPKHSKLNKQGRRAVQEVLPPATLFAHLQPRRDWIATAACIAEIGGTHPLIPVQTEVDAEMRTAPGPFIELLLNGDRKLIFSDQKSADRVSIWNERAVKKGHLKQAEQHTARFKPNPITNPPVPAVATLMNLPEPPVRHTAFPPGPLSGDHQ